MKYRRQDQCGGHCSITHVSAFIHSLTVNYFKKNYEGGKNACLFFLRVLGIFRTGSHFKLEGDFFDWDINDKYM